MMRSSSGCGSGDCSIGSGCIHRRCSMIESEAAFGGGGGVTVGGVGRTGIGASGTKLTGCLFEVLFGGVGVGGSGAVPGRKSP